MCLDRRGENRIVCAVATNHESRVATQIEVRIVRTDSRKQQFIGRPRCRRQRVELAVVHPRKPGRLGTRRADTFKIQVLIAVFFTQHAQRCRRRKLEVDGQDLAHEVERQVVLVLPGRVDLENIQQERPLEIFALYDCHGPPHRRTGVSVGFYCAYNLHVGVGVVVEMKHRVMLTADLIFALEVRSLVLRDGVVGNRLFGPGRIFFQVVAAALLFDIDETDEPVVLQNFVPFLVQ